MKHVIVLRSNITFRDIESLCYQCSITGLMSVVGQQMDYLRTALRTLELTSENQYKIRGQPRYDKVRWSTAYEPKRFVIDFACSPVQTTVLYTRS